MLWIITLYQVLGQELGCKEVIMVMVEKDMIVQDGRLVGVLAKASSGGCETAREEARPGQGRGCRGRGHAWRK